ncbi:AarF/ABC1/UbiB kinase family protein [Planktotalea sp.]|uniref:ABC1 kinase family protein n=1 Tax=Planktotalea sp. TaxID=2029877 RepID=UPI003296A882
MRLLWTRLKRGSTPTDYAILVRSYFEKLGFLWIKVGQLLSLRRDFFTEEFCTELSRMQHQSIGFSPKIAVDRIEKELGAPISAVFSEFSETPFAAASIAQVHRGTLRSNGADVVVKVRRPGAETIFYYDLRAIRRLTWLLERLGALTFLRWKEALWELEEIMNEETDYRFEFSNLKRMRKVLKKHGIYVPDAYPEYCTSAILVIEMIPGLLMSDFVAAQEKAPDELAAWMVENNVDPQKVGRDLNTSFLRQLFEEEMFHGDVHPGNVILLRDSKIALIDFGTIGSPERELWRRYLYIVKAFASREFQKAGDLILSLCPELPLVNIDEVREDIVRSLRSWHMRTGIEQMSYHERSATKALTGVLDIMGESRMMVTWGFLRIDRTWATLDASLYHLIPDADYPKIFERYFKQRARRMYTETYNWENIGRAMVEVPETLGELRLFLEPQLRRSSRVYGSFTSKVTQSASLLLRAMSRLAFLFALHMMLTSYIQLKGEFELDNSITDFLHTTVTIYPDMDWPFWVISIWVAFYSWFVLRRMSNSIGSDDVRIPNNSTT